MKCERVSNHQTIAATVLFTSASALTIAALVAVTMLIVSSRDAAAKPEFATQTSLPCGQCHVNPGGSGKLKSFGEKFKANGFKVK
jgi:hypothetical protein